MAKTINIPVELSFNREALDRLKTSLQEVSNNARGLYSPEQQAQAKQLIQNINTQASSYDKLAESGKIGEKALKTLSGMFESTAESAGRLAHNIDKSLSLEKVLSQEDLSKIQEYQKEINNLEQEFIDLDKGLENLNVADVLAEFDKTPQDFKLGNVKNLDKGMNQLIEKRQKLIELNKGGRGGDAAKEERAARSLEIKELDDIIKALEKRSNFEKTTSKTTQDALDENINKRANLKTKIQEVETTAINAAKKEALEIDKVTEEVKQNNDQLQQKIKLEQISEKLNPLKGFTTGIASGFGRFVEGIASGVIIINGLRRVMRDTISTIKELDQAFNQIAMVTTYTTDEVWKMKDAFIGIAETTGLSVVKVTELAGEFFRQGRSLSETLKLTEAAGIAANVAGISAGDSVNYLTSAINAYRLSADQAMSVSDKFAALAAGSATDYEELAVALSKVAAQAYTAGVNMDNMMGFIAKALEVTREAPENIGTAFKTIFARMSELKDYGKTLEDGMDVNRVDKALASIGVSLTNQSNELRNLDDVLIDVGHKWNSLNKNQKAYVTTALAGTRQQTRLLAVFEDFDRTMELTEISANSLGATFAQQEKYYNSIAYAQNNLTVAWQEFISSLGSSDAFIAFYNAASGLVGVLNTLVETFKSFGVVLVLLGVAFTALTVSTVRHNNSLIQKIALQELSKGATMKEAMATALSTVANWAEVASIKAYIAAQYEALKASLASGNILAWASVIVLGLVAAYTALTLAIGSSEKKNKEFVETMKKSQASIFNLRKEADDLETLLEKYNKINNSIVKSNEDLEEQNQLIQQMQDLLGEDISAVDLTGKFNADIIEDQIQKLRDDADEEFKDSIETTKKEYGTLAKAYIETTDTIVRQQILIQNAIENKQIESYSQFLGLESEKRAQILATEQLRLDAETMLTKPVYKESLGTGASTLEYEVDTDKLEEAERLLNELFSRDFSNSTLVEQINQLNELDFTNWDEGITKALAKSMPQLEAINTLMARLNVTSTQALQSILSGSILTEGQIMDLNTAVSNLNIDIELQNELFNDLVKSGPNFFQTIIDFANESNLSMFDTLDITQQLKDSLNDITIESLSDQVQSLRGINANLDKVNAMISGDESYDLAFLNEMASLYPEIGAAIAANAEISAETRAKIVKDEKAKFAANIDLQIKDLEANIELNDLRIKEYQKMLESEIEFLEWASDEKNNVEINSIADIQNAWSEYRKTQVKDEIDLKKKLLEINKEFLTPEDYTKQLNSLNAAEQGLDASLSQLFPTLDKGSGSAQTFAEKVNEAIAALQSSNESIRAQISVLNNLKNNIDKVTAATNASTEAAEEYKATLNDIIVLTEQLNALQEQLSKYQFMEENAKTGEDYVVALYAQNEALEAQNNLLEDTIDAQERQQDSLYASLGDLQNVVSIVNGRMIVSMKKYLSLAPDQQEAIDNVVESYNDLSSGISDNTMQLDENTAAIEENLQKIEDKTVELYDVLKEAITKEEEEKLKILNDSLDEEKKLLDTRRKMYEDAFAEQDYTESLNDINTERQTLITQLSNLEGATDLASVKRRQELLDRKAELDKEYNQLYTDYNREALLESLDNEEQLIDDKQAAYEAEYEERINSVEWLENRITEIMNMGMDDRIAYLKANLPEYENAWTISKDNIQSEWEILFGIVDTTVDEIQNKIPDFSGMIAQIKEAIGELNTLTGISDVSPSSPPPLPPPSVKEVSRYTSWSGSLTYLYSGGGMYFYKETGTIYIKMSDGSTKTEATSRTVAKPAPTTTKTTAAPNTMSATGTFNTVGGPQFATGGLANFTGPAWLDGTPSRPERVLSPFQTELFDNMVSSLERGATTSNLNESINIENITIQTTQLNTNADFASAGKTLAMELKTAIAERGININKKR